MFEKTFLMHIEKCAQGKVESEVGALQSIVSYSGGRFSRENFSYIIFGWDQVETKFKSYPTPEARNAP